MSSKEKFTKAGFDEYVGSDGKTACYIKLSGSRVLYHKEKHPEADKILSGFKGLPGMKLVKAKVS